MSLGSWMQPRVPQFNTDEWQVIEAPFDVAQMMVIELIPSVIYEFQIRAVDTANPPNRSAWSRLYGVHGVPGHIATGAACCAVCGRFHGSPSRSFTISAPTAGGTFNLDLDTAVPRDPRFRG